MNKIKITQLTCFDELARVVHMGKYDIIYLQHNTLIAAFSWRRSPQGPNFWKDIYKMAHSL